MTSVPNKNSEDVSLAYSVKESLKNWTMPTEVDNVNQTLCNIEFISVSFCLWKILSQLPRIRWVPHRVNGEEKWNFETELDISLDDSDNKEDG